MKLPENGFEDFVGDFIGLFEVARFAGVGKAVA
jgi:hypothetical protein